MALNRQLEIILTHNGGAEVVDMATEQTVWASDADDDFREEFPEFLDEDDVPHLLDYLIDAEEITDDEADAAEISMESLAEATANATGPGDEDDDDDGEDD